VGRQGIAERAAIADQCDRWTARSGNGTDFAGVAGERSECGDVRSGDGDCIVEFAGEMKRKKRSEISGKRAAKPTDTVEIVVSEGFE